MLIFVPSRNGWLEMGCEHKMARNLHGQEPARPTRHISATDRSFIAIDTGRAIGAVLCHLILPYRRTFAALLDPPTLAALGLAGARILGVVA